MVSEYMDKFNPSDFGLSRRYVGSGRGNRSKEAMSKCYVINQLNGKNQKTLTVVLSHTAGKRSIELLGERVDFDFDKDGVIYLWPGNSRRISKRSKGSARFNISVGCMYGDYTSRMGEFRRLYLKPEFNGNHVKLIPTGERDVK